MFVTALFYALRGMHLAADLLFLCIVSSLFCGRCSLCCTHGMQSTKKKKSKGRVHSPFAALCSQRDDAGNDRGASECREQLSSDTLNVRVV